MNASTLASTRATWLAGICLAATAAIYLAFFFIPNMRSIRVTLADLESQHAFILDAQKTRRVGEQLQTELNETVAYVEKHQRQLLQQHDVPKLFSQISHITRTHGVTTTKFEPQPPVAYETLSKVSIGLGLSGKFPAVHEALCDLEGLEAQIWVDDLKFHGPRESGKTTEAEMILVVFVDNPEKSD